MNPREIQYMGIQFVSHDSLTSKFATDDDMNSRHALLAQVAEESDATILA
eukprot:CAMPEP_0117419802 /NCGR_PEP_ID=MMETSP0758-20121206/1287_1 /TAXON_ID=63605 /ORGANISM="Percolomonas cosmopolitus, Strain AE-1 (ATCC 50343)" /LENGTH=49 /DNA_ID= /DNA_START= /DNA_END= /DNA_ORIENTATION=